MIHHMPEPTNLTERISHLRDRKGSSIVVKGSDAPEPSTRAYAKKRQPERRLATDYFMLFVYALLAVALIAQMALIVWLDVL